MAERLPVDPAAPDPSALARAVAVLRTGELVVYPTETLYGIGADPFSEQALLRVQQAKRRADPKPVLLITAGLHEAEPFIASVPPAAALLADAFWPGPLTLLFAARNTVSRHLTQGTGRIGVRVPSSLLCRRLAALFGAPITSTSANRTGEPTPSDVAGIERVLAPAISLYLDAGALPPSKPSTIVDLTETPCRLTREGTISAAQIRSIIPDATT
ncbi:MAG TPA: L-threonylcarbamoyladenylate synthase [Bacteroidota bacterium]